METNKLREELVTRIPAVQRFQRNPDRDPEINVQNYKVFKEIEGELMDFLDEMITKLFEL